ncbi:hypothetical protein [Nonomuraea soli]|uniref:Ferredoxin-NADP reductase n=1 Tax=Nonomuraea soli TaxID=1032476 RepID=A0A7W0HSC2_9ACTN|nr:hypothetical protein [Nonomuraea soli]MBA2893918.1 ferredoxin-NADP reductase [Nonomuraea soli]
MTSPVLIAADIDTARLERLLARLPQGAPTVVRTQRVTAELREIQRRRGLVLVVGDEHDPRVKEQVSASGLARLLPDIGEREVRLAGPRPFRKYVRGALKRIRARSA